MAQAEIICKEIGTYFANPADCGSFYQCGKDLVPYLHKCGEGLVFDPSLNVCVWPRDYNCVETSK